MAIVLLLPATQSPAQPPVANDSESKIVFASTRSGNSEIYLMNADGSDQIRLTTNSANDAEPAFSPDGARIAFTSDRGGMRQIYIMGYDGTEVTRLTNGPGYCRRAAFSPDGSKIAFERWETEEARTRADIWIMSVDGSSQTSITGAADEGGYHPAWSPDSKRVAFIATDKEWATKLAVMDADGGNRRALPQAPTTVYGESGTHTHNYCFHPAWSRDGSRILFSSTVAQWLNPDKVESTSEDRRTRWIDSNRNIGAFNTDIPLASYNARFSPGGDKIVYVAGPCGRADSSPFDYNKDRYEIWVMNADGSGQVRLTENTSRDDWPSWGPAFVPPS